MKEKYFVGIDHNFNFNNLFKSSFIPTIESHGKRFKAVIGPFKTRRGAEFMALYGKNNPHCQHIEDAERLSKEI